MESISLFVQCLYLLLDQFVFPGQIFVVGSEEELKGLQEDNALAFRKDLRSLYFRDENGWKPIQVQRHFEYTAMEHVAILVFWEQEHVICILADAVPGD